MELGIALQLTNILRDVGDDLRRRALRNFVETCLLTLGRMPHTSERAEGSRGRTAGEASTEPETTADVAARPGE